MFKSWRMLAIFSLVGLMVVLYGCGKKPQDEQLKVQADQSKTQTDQPRSEGQPKPTDNPNPSDNLGTSDSHDSPALKLKITETLLYKSQEWLEDSFAVSPDSRHTAWLIKRGEKTLAVIDGVGGKEYDDVLKDTLVFSPDSKRVTYKAKRGEKWLAVVDGVEGKEYDKVGLLAVSPDSKRLAYFAERAGEQFLVVDGIEKKEDRGSIYQAIIFSPDSVHIAYLGYLAVVVDGVEVGDKKYGGIGNLCFSPDSKRVAYMARSDETWCVVVDGVESKEDYDEIIGQGFYRTRQQCTVESMEDYNKIEIGGLRFSPDSKRLAYAAMRRLDPPGHEAQGHEEYFVVVDDVVTKEAGRPEAPPMFGPREIVFSPDSKHVAYVAYRNGYCVVVDGVEGKKYNYVECPRFSSDSNRVAYDAEQGEKWLVVVDGVEEKNYDLVGNIAFSPDSKHVAYGAKRDEKWFVIVDGTESKEYDAIYQGPRRFDSQTKYQEFQFFFDSPTKLHTLAKRDGEIFLVEIEIEQ